MGTCSWFTLKSVFVLYTFVQGVGFYRDYMGGACVCIGEVLTVLSDQGAYLVQ